MITKQQLDHRKNYLCGSDMASLFTDSNGKSLNPYANSLDIYTQKVFELKPEKESEAQRLGNKYEELLITFAGEELNTSIETNPNKLEFINQDILDKNGNTFLMAHLDGYTVNEPHEIIECKTTGLTAEYGQEYTDDVPMRVILQVHMGFLCTGFKMAHIVVLLGRWGLKEEIFAIERNEKIIEAIIERGLQFWNDNILKKIPPPDSEPGNLQLFKRICRIPASYAEIDPMLLTTWETLKETRLNAEKEEDEALAEILKSLGDAEAVLINDGREFTYFEFKSKRVDSQILKKEFPEVYEKVTSENQYRVPRIRKI